MRFHSLAVLPPGFPSVSPGESGETIPQSYSIKPGITRTPDCGYSLNPQKRTFVGVIVISALCQKRTLSRLFDHLVGALQDCFGKVMPNALRLKTIKRRIAESGSVVCIYIPGNGMISTISIHAPGICRWGWSLSNIFVAASCDSACTTE